MRLKEVAKFFCGFEAFHAVAHTYFWSTGMTLTFVGITATPTVSLVGAVLNAAIALLLGAYAWGRPAAVRSTYPAAEG
jgi:hypothetical protein